METKIIMRRATKEVIFLSLFVIAYTRKQLKAVAELVNILHGEMRTLTTNAGIYHFLSNMEAIASSKSLVLSEKTLIAQIVNLQTMFLQTRKRNQSRR